MHFDSGIRFGIYPKIFDPTTSKNKSVNIIMIDNR